MANIDDASVEFLTVYIFFVIPFWHGTGVPLDVNAEINTGVDEIIVNIKYFTIN